MKRTKKEKEMKRTKSEDVIPFDGLDDDSKPAITWLGRDLYARREEAAEKLEDLIRAAGADGVDAADLLARSHLSIDEFSCAVRTLVGTDAVVERVTRIGCCATERHLWHLSHWHKKRSRG